MVIPELPPTASLTGIRSQRRIPQLPPLVRWSSFLPKAQGALAAKVSRCLGRYHAFCHLTPPAARPLCQNLCSETKAKISGTIEISAPTITKNCNSAAWLMVLFHV